MSPSTREPQALPDLTKSLAMLDAIIYPEWERRYYSFSARWNVGEEMASMRNGSGDDWFLLFAAGGAALKGFAHESAMACDRTLAEQVQRVLPVGFESFLHEPAFRMEEVSFCLWRGRGELAWNVVRSAAGNAAAEDGSVELLGMLDGDPRTYQAWAEEYYEREVSLEGVRRIYAHEPLSTGLVAKLNPEVTLADVEADEAEIGYPDLLRT